ncbi:MAG: Crp/Fnr family transcriptional regulator [Mycobacteriales bacterium]|nr:Crp/Fnr family transcriptional regulator [Frankia sp.]
MPDATALLSGVSVFSGATPEELARVVSASFPRRLARGQVLFVEGEPSEHLFVVISGRVKVLVGSTRGEELVLAVLGPGDALGELGILDGDVRSAGAEALDDVELLAVPAAVVVDLLAQSPRVAHAVAQELAATVRRLTGSTADLVFLDLPRRLAKLLLETAGPGSDDAELGMAQSEVAARLGVTRQSLNRALAGLQRRGWIEVQRNHVRLRARDALERFATS